MAKGPVFYHDMDKKIRDLLYNDYMSGRKVVVTCHESSGLEITSTVAKTDVFSVSYGTELKNENITTNVNVGANSNNIFQHFTSITLDEPIPGLKAILNYILPYNRYGKVELQYRHKCAAISTSLVTTANPILNFSSMFGIKSFAVGIDLSFDSASRNFTKHNAGFYLSLKDILTASFTLNHKGGNFTGSVLFMNKSSSAWGFEICANRYSSESTLTVGFQHLLNPITLMKIRLNNHGKVSALIHHDVNPRTRFTVCGEMKTLGIERSVKVGLALALKP